MTLKISQGRGYAIIRNMIITYHGHEFFRIQFGDIVVATNPPDSPSAHKGPRFGADIVLVSVNHEDFNGALTMSHGARSPFVVSGPGEYEVKDVVIRGFAGAAEYGGKKLINTLYLLSLEGMQLGFLGPLGNPILPTDAKEGFDNIDVLFLPVGGGPVLSAKDAYKLALAIEPKRIIPMHYEEKTGALAAFYKEAGESLSTRAEKVTLKKKELSENEGEIISLKVS